MAAYDEVEILLVEDSEEDAELTVRALHTRRLANKLHHVEDGAAALDFLFGRGDYSGRDINHRPKVVLLDLKLPKVDGIEVLEKLKAEEHLRAIPVVMLTTSREETDLVRSYKLGVNAYVVKPVAFHEFIEAIQDLGVFWAVLNEPPPGSLKPERKRESV